MPSVIILIVLAPQFPPHRGILISAGDPTFSHHFKSWKYFLTEKNEEINNVVTVWGLYYKTYFGRNLRIFVISYSVCPWQVFPA
jgi:hypothetical protein